MMNTNMIEQQQPTPENNGDEASRSEMINRAMGLNDLLTISDMEKAKEEGKDQLINSIVERMGDLESEIQSIKQQIGMGSQSQGQATASIGMPQQAPNMADQIASSLLQQQAMM